jgi:hypothetical protein
MAVTGVDSSGQDQAIKVGNPIVYNMPTPASYGSSNTAFTVNDVIGGLIVQDPGATGNLNINLPTAAALAAAVPGGVRIGDCIECLIVNGSLTSGTVTLVATSGVSFDANQNTGAQKIPFASSKYITCRFTNVTPGSYAYTIYA